MIDILKGEINFLKSAWQNLLGRPLVTLALRRPDLGRLGRVFRVHQRHMMVSVVMVVVGFC